MNESPELDRPSGMRASAGTIAFWAAAALIVIAKLWMTAGDEVMAVHSPHDAEWHIRAAVRAYWGSCPYDELTFVHLPFYSLFVSANAIFGIPLRVTTELFYAASAGFFCYAIWRCGMPRLGVLFIFATIVFWPIAGALFRYTLPDAVNAQLFMLVAGCLILLWNRKSDRWGSPLSAITGLCMSAAWLNRKESGPLLLVACGFLALCILWTMRHSGELRGSGMRRLSRSVIVPLLVVALCVSGVKALNYKRFGLFETSELASEGFRSCYRALLRIAPRRVVRYASITREARQMAYRASPSFAKLKIFLEGEVGASWECYGQQMYGLPKGEIGTGWFYWAIREAARHAGEMTSARASEAYFQKIADEVNAACDSGKLPTRNVFSGVFDPEWQSYIGDLPSAIRALSRKFLMVIPEQGYRYDAPGVEPEVQLLFDRMCARRRWLTAPPDAQVIGWLLFPGRELTDIAIRTKEGRVISNTIKLGTRPDVAAKRATGYILSANGDVCVAPERYSWHMAFDDGTVIDRPVKTTESHRIDEIFTASDGTILKFCVDELTLPHIGANRDRDAVRAFVAQWHPWILAASLVLGGIGLVLSAATRRVKSAWLGPAAVLGIMAFSRLALFILLDISSWNGLDLRYIFPAFPLLLGCTMLLFMGGVQSAWMRVCQRSVEDEPAMDASAASTRRASARASAPGGEAMDC